MIWDLLLGYALMAVLSYFVLLKAVRRRQDRNPDQRLDVPLMVESAAVAMAMIWPVSLLVLAADSISGKGKTPPAARRPKSRRGKK
jgi:hypothetical protein